MADHSDNEAEYIVRNSTIAAISLFGACTLQIKDKKTREILFEQLLQDGSLYTMEGTDFQVLTTHGILAGDARGSITFRHLHPIVPPVNALSKTVIESVKKRPRGINTGLRNVKTVIKKKKVVITKKKNQPELASSGRAQ